MSRNCKNKEIDNSDSEATDFLVRRLFEKVKICPHSNCWTWTGAHTSQGYPTFWVARSPEVKTKYSGRLKKYAKARGTQLSVRRLMYLIYKSGPTSSFSFNQIVSNALKRKCEKDRIALSGGYASVTCNNRSCINPLHAFLPKYEKRKELRSLNNLLLTWIYAGVDLYAAGKIVVPHDRSLRYELYAFSREQFKKNPLAGRNPKTGAPSL